MHRPLQTKILTAALALALALAAIQPAAAQDLRQTGKKLKADCGDAVVIVKIVLSNSGDSTIQGETCGTVISPDGLVVVPLFTIDPTQVAKRMMGPLGEGLPLNTQVRDIKITFGKQPEVPATVVLRDNDLNLALLRPLTKPKQPVKCVDLANAEAAPEALDPIVMMTRLGNVGNREVALLPGTIQAVVSKPRQLFVPVGGFAGFGIPAFSASGKLLGVTLLQISLGGMQDAQAGFFSLNLSHMGIMPAILPVDQLKEVADQAPKEAKPLPTPEAKPEKKAAPAEEKAKDAEKPAVKPAVKSGGAKKK